MVFGVATCTIDDETFVAGPGHSVDVPLGAKHRLANQGPEELVIVEVQHGAYTGEDDICRLEDDYDRRGRLRPRAGDHTGPRASGGQCPLLIIPAPTVTPVASSIRMNDPVVRFLA